MTIKEADILKDIPSGIDHNKTLRMISTGRVSYKHLESLKTLTSLNDKKIATWFDISEKTFRAFKAHGHDVKARILEHTVMALSLIKHGAEVFGTTDAFTAWLEKENFYFDKKAPIAFMDTYSGIKFIDDRLTAMEFGDNV